MHETDGRDGPTDVVDTRPRPGGGDTPRTRAEHRAATERRVVAAAQHLFETRGVAATTVREIARTAEVSVGTVMAVGDKDTLLVRVVDDLVEGGHASVAAARSGAAPSRSARGEDRVLEVVRPFVELLTDRAELATAWAAVLVLGRTPSRVAGELGDRLVADVRAALEAGGTPPDRAERTARALYAAYVGVLFLASARGEVDPDAVLSRLRETFAAICSPQEDP